MTRTRLVLFLTLLAAIVPYAVVAAAGTTPFMLRRLVHFGLVSAAAAIASVASLALSIAGARARDGRSVLMGIAFSTMTAMFAVHALSTPGFIAGKNGMIALAGGLSVPIGAALLALTALPALRRSGNVQPLIIVQGVLFVAVLMFGLIGLSMPESIPAVPQAKSTAALVLLGSGSAFLAILILRALRTYMLTRRGADLTVALGCAWLGVTLYANLAIGAMTVAWMLGHVLEIAAVMLVTIPAALDIKRAGASRPLVGDLTATELVASEHAYLGPRVRALMVQLERPRHLHRGAHPPRRPARRARRRGAQALRHRPPAPRRRRPAARHRQARACRSRSCRSRPRSPTRSSRDQAPPGRRPAPARGARRLPGGRANLVSDHHERLDGSGYPRGLTADQMTIDTRILAVCDVYDALVSDRVYRAAWSAGARARVAPGGVRGVRPDGRGRAPARARLRDRVRRRSRRARSAHRGARSPPGVVCARPRGRHKIASRSTHGRELVRMRWRAALLGMVIVAAPAVPVIAFLGADAPPPRLRPRRRPTPPCSWSRRAGTSRRGSL